MNGAFEVGAVALKAQQRALETIANNVANVNTPAFKRAEVQFAEVVNASPDAITEAERLATETMAPTGGVRMSTRSMISEAGEMRASGEAMDIAIDGQGFIELMGQDGETMLWRGGRLTVDRDGYLSASNGMALRALITVPDDVTELVIDRDGVVSGSGNDSEKLELGQIMLVNAESEADLERLDAGLFRLAEGARALDAVPGEDGVGTIQQGMVEGSNVEMTAAMVEMLVLQRAYAASAQVIQAADQISSITNNLKR
ncbi:flagellar hook-basal body protein [Parerythrobacter jejuensis]|uniref:Flagellar hook-basal body complex protein n=1 Tax=Parerythrobacter jejuensis TaxID=795812 RepID=A0A845AX18_9SPHN|nr:flagellar hook basal-body protein [Parerythrobacter jejuensis]MXP30561.1 flagellar hook-basal body complex protein [Parerythrobacter jejuensis]MXP33321.1 flagellar hook-basal body complex protein [Parerythrobacter jejuensis]